MRVIFHKAAPRLYLYTLYLYGYKLSVRTVTRLCGQGCGGGDPFMRAIRCRKVTRLCVENHQFSHLICENRRRDSRAGRPQFEVAAWRGVVEVLPSYLELY